MFPREVKLQIERASVERTQRIYARVAGILFLWLIVNILVSTLTFPHIPVSGTFAETAERIAASEHLYRLGLLSEVIETLSAVMLAFALYVTLKPVHSLFALLATIFYLQDSFLAGVVHMCGFVRLHLYTSVQPSGAGTVLAQTLVDFTRSIAGATESIGGISFGIALLLFFYLFFKSRLIPRMLSLLGLSASAIWTGLYFANLVFPEQHTVFRYICFPSMTIAVVATGFYLTLFRIKTQGSSNQTAHQRLRPGSAS